MATLPKKEVRISRGAFAARPVRSQHPAPEVADSAQRPRRLGELLVESGMVTAEQLEQALAHHTARRCFLGQALVELGAIDQDTLVAFLVKQTNIPHLNLTDYQIQRDVLELMPVEFCRRYQVVPIDRLGSMLTVALVDPFDHTSFDAVRSSYSQFRIKPMLCSWVHFNAVLDRRQGNATMGNNPLGLTPMRDEHLEPEHGSVAQKSAMLGVDAEAEEAPHSLEPSQAIGPGDEFMENGSVELETGRAFSAPARRDDAIIASSWIDAFFGEDASEDPPDAVDAASTCPPPPAESATPPDSATDESDEEGPASANEPPEAAEIDRPSSDLADIVRDSIRDAVGLVARAIRERDDGQPPPSAQELAGSLRGAVYSAIKGLGDRVSSETVLDAVGDDFPQIQAATQRALREAEAVVVAEARLHELELAHRRKHLAFTLPRYHSVHALGNPEQSVSPQDTDDVVLSALESEQPLQEFRFDDFFVDKSNAFTFSLCRAVAESPGCDYNPFFLYGNVGVGKTHLINAIGNFIQSRDEKTRVGYVSAIFFASRLGDAVQDGAVKAFRDNYCHWDVLILDDMQFLAGRVDAQEEFFHIFNALHQAGRQIIIAGDQAPDRLGLLEERLVSRFSGGIVAHLRPPNYDTRLAILRHHVRLRDVAVPEEVLAFMAHHVTDDVRKLTGSLRKVLAFADLVGQDITLDMATEILGHLGVAEAV